MVSRIRMVSKNMVSKRRPKYQGRRILDLAFYIYRLPSFLVVVFTIKLLAWRDTFQLSIHLRKDKTKCVLFGKGNKH